MGDGDLVEQNQTGIGQIIPQLRNLVDTRTVVIGLVILGILIAIVLLGKELYERNKKKNDIIVGAQN